MKHTILLPDRSHGREPRRIVWDDEAGTVEGEHSSVPWMQGVLAQTPPVDWHDEGHILVLEDPAHDPRDFWWLLIGAFWPVLDEPLRSTMPPVLRDVEPREARAPTVPDITLPDGTTRPAVPGVDFVY